MRYRQHLQAEELISTSVVLTGHVVVRCLLAVCESWENLLVGNKMGGESVQDLSARGEDVIAEANRTRIMCNPVQGTRARV